MNAPDPHPAQQRLGPLAWALLLALALLWGASFLANRVALEEVGVLSIVAFRVSVAALALWLYVAARGLPVAGLGRKIPAFAGMGLLNNAIPFTLIVWGQTRVPSGLAGILNASTAIFAVVIAAIVFADERLTARRAAGVATGFAGVALVLGPEVLRRFDPGAAGQLALIAAAVSYAVAASFARLFLAGIRPEVQAAGMLSAAAFLMLPLALVAEGLPRAAIGWPSLAALLYLALAASALAYILFYRILALAGAGNLLLVTLMLAPVAVALGALFYGETLRPNEYAGFGVIAAGLLILDGRPRRLFARAKATNSA